MRLFPSPSPPPSPPLLRLDGPGVAAIGAGLVLCTAVAATPPRRAAGAAGGWSRRRRRAAFEHRGGRRRRPLTVTPPSLKRHLGRRSSTRPAGRLPSGAALLGRDRGRGIHGGQRQYTTAERRRRGAWLAANGAQSLWCAAFRPWALDRLWLSAGCLGATASFLALAQRRALALARGRRLLVLVPRSLHLGWVTAAALVNVNAWIGYSAARPGRRARGGRSLARRRHAARCGVHRRPPPPRRDARRRLGAARARERRAARRRRRRAGAASFEGPRDFGAGVRAAARRDPALPRL